MEYGAVQVSRNMVQLNVNNNLQNKKPNSLVIEGLLTS